MIELLAIILLGISAGVVTGLIPGIHPNTVVFTSLPIYFAYRPELKLYLVFIVAISVSHTFHDFLPAIFLHAPSATTALSTLPGAEAAAQGKGLQAFYRTAAGGLISVSAVLLLLPILFVVLKPIYGFIEPLMLYVLVFFLLFAILDSDKVFVSAQIAALSGFLGIYSFNMPVNQNFVLVPVFTGLFAVPAMIFVLRNDEELPEQEKDFETQISVRSGVVGTLAGLLAGIVPGIGPAISTSFLSPLQGDEGNFLTALGGVNSSDMVASLVALYLLNAPRSGASVAVSQITSLSQGRMAVLLGATFLAAAIAFATALKVSTVFVSLINRLDFTRVVAAVLLGIFSITFLFTGVFGLLVLFTASMIGFCARAAGERTVLMAVLILPSIMFFSGHGVVM